MKLGKEQKIREMVEEFHKLEKENHGTTNCFDCLARDKMRKIRKNFKKMFNESIDKYL